MLQDAMRRKAGRAMDGFISRNGGSEKGGVAGRGQLASSSGKEEEVTFAEFMSSPGRDGSFGNGKNRKSIGSLVADGVGWGKGELFDPEEFTLGDDGSARSVHGGFEVTEVDALHRLLDMKLARLAIEPDTVPIEDPVGGVGVLLDFVDEESGTDGVEPA